jgi:hypothetical protein
MPDQIRLSLSLKVTPLTRVHFISTVQNHVGPQIIATTKSLRTNLTLIVLGLVVLGFDVVAEFVAAGVFFVADLAD